MKRILSLILCFVLILALLPGMLGARSLAAESIPEGFIPISTPEDLFLARYDLTANYILTADIDLTEALAEGGSLYDKTNGWISLGYSPTEAQRVAFTGIFDGNGHSIRGMLTKGAGAGFIWTNKGTIKNLTIADGSYSGANTLGAIANYNYGTIENCHNAATVSYTSGSGYVGGITGHQYSKAKIQNCSNNGTVSISYSSYVSSDFYAGGIAGCCEGGTIDTVYNVSSVSNTSPYRSHAGGIAGYISGTTTLSNAYNTGKISAQNTYTNSSESKLAYAGGIAAYQNGSSKITTCYNIGTVTASFSSTSYTYPYVGSICGRSYSTGNITKCYYLNTMTDAIGNNTNHSCISLSSLMMERQMAFNGFDFTNVWIMGTGDYKYPVLRSMMITVPDESVANIDPTIYHTLNLASDISLNYIVTVADLKDYDSFYMECVLPEYEGNTYVGNITLNLEPVLKGDYYYFVLEGLQAINLSDEIQATLCAFKDSVKLRSQTDKYSVSTYAYNKLNDPSTSENLAILCAELLRYGATAQSYKEYRTDYLASRNMTVAHKALLSNLDSVVFSRDDTLLNDVVAPTITWVGKALNLDSKVTVRYVFNAKDYKGSIEDLTLRISYIAQNGEPTMEVLTNPEVYSASEARYVFDFDSLTAAEMRTVLTAAIYEGSKQVSATTGYSIASYGSNRTGDLLTMSQALVAYGDAAANYFGK